MSLFFSSREYRYSPVIIPYSFPLFPTFTTYTTAATGIVNDLSKKICLAGGIGARKYYKFVRQIVEIDLIPSTMYPQARLKGEEQALSLYRVHFKWKEKEIQLTARSLDLTHPYFVSIKDLVFQKKEKIIINPAEDDVIRAFGGSKHLMIPFQTVSLIEEVDENNARLRAFTLVEEEAPPSGER
jgi:hypothetical protein